MNRLVTEKCKTLKAMGRQSLRGHWAEAILLVLLCEIIVTGPSILYDLIPTKFQTVLVATIFNVYALVIHGPISFSLANFFMKVFRQEHCDKAGVELKYGFGQLKKAMSIYIRIMIITWLGSIFFVIPGIIAALNYSQAFYILADDPTKHPAQCMYESKFIMRGNKIKYLSLMISFLGWYLLAAIPAVICHIVLDASSIEMMRDFIMKGDMYGAMIQANITHPLVNILMFLQVIIAPYVNATKISFFDILCGKLVVQQYDDFSAKDYSQSGSVDFEVVDTKPIQDENQNGENVDDQIL